MQANGLRGGRGIKAGQTLQIPAVPVRGRVVAAATPQSSSRYD